MAVQSLVVKPSAVLINANNKGYARVLLDQESLKFVYENLHRFKSDINRSYLWRTLCDLIKIYLVKPNDFLQCLIDHIVLEDEEYTMPVVFENALWVLKFLLTPD